MSELIIMQFRAISRSLFELLCSLVHSVKISACPILIYLSILQFGFQPDGAVSVAVDI